MKKLLFVLTIICTILSSCKKDPVITISVDKTEISADGKDIATFKVMCDDEKDVTNDCRIFFSNTKEELESITFSTTEPNTYSFYATYDDIVSNNTITITAIEVINEEDEEDDNDDDAIVEAPIVLSASTDTIIANGEDVISFTIMQDTVNVTSLSEIFINDSLINGNVFRTNIAGHYTVYAKKNDTIVSNKISFFAKEVNNNEEEGDDNNNDNEGDNEGDIEDDDNDDNAIVEAPIVLSASTDTITADGKDIIEFTVLQDTANVTNSTKIFVNDNPIIGNKFSTTEAGSYKVYAKKDDIVSNEISFFAKEVKNNDDEDDDIIVEIPIVISASTDTIIANGEDVISFTIMQDTVNVTSLSEIFINDSLINGNVFRTNIAGHYTVYAKKNDTIVSNKISFFAKEVIVEEENPIVLTASKTSILADGKDKVTFTVKQDDNDITSETKIYVGENKLRLNTFTSTTAGTYTAYAMKGELKSNEITIVVEEIVAEVPIVLSASTDTITADGKDIIEFTVLQDTANVTNSTKIFVNDNPIIGNKFSTTEAGSYKVYAKKDDIVSNEITFFAKEVIVEEESPILLTASKTSILANGKDKVTFTVKQDDNDITSETKIYVGENKLRLNTFTSTTAGTYTAYAMKGELKSNEITIVVEEISEDAIVLTASKTSISADDKDMITFTVKQSDKDITSETEIYVNNNKINGNTFTTSVAGTYKVYAKKGELKSNEISITATAVAEPEKPIVLTASTTNISANGSDAVTFTVTQENKDVTSQSNIFVNGSKLSGNKFTTYTAGSYTVYAKKNDVTSNEITIYAEAIPDMGKTVVFAEGVSVSSGWYDVNKLTKGGEDVNMCWAAASANIIQWWQDRYVAAGNTLPSTAITGEGTKSYNGTKYNLAIMEAYRDLWDNSRGGSVSHGVTWYFEGRNIMKEASAGTHAQPLSNNTGGYYANDWNKILPNIYHGYDYVIVPGILEYNDLISGEFNNYSIWAGLSGNASLKKFSDLVVEFIDRGVTSLTVALAANLGSIHHATTLWGYEIDNATGIITKVWLTDSDDMHQTGESGNPTEQKLREYAVSYNEGTGTIKFSGAPYGACYAVSLYPVSGYGSR